MRTSTKIRWLLFLVTFGLFATSLTARWASTKLVNLFDVADQISENLGAKETFVYDYLASNNGIKNLRNLKKDPILARNTIEYFTKENIFFQTFNNNQLVFWSDAIINTTNVQGLKEGTSFVKYAKGWYEVIKQKEGDFFVIFLIPVKFDFPYKNQYLNNGFNQQLVIDNTLEIADLTDFPVVDVKNIEGRYLFSIKKSTSNTLVPYSKIEITLWILGFIILGLLINSISKYFADKGSPIFAGILLIIAFSLLRYLGLKYHFPDALYSLELFNPNIYASSFFFPSFADLGLNVIVLLWIVLFIHSYKNKIFRKINSPWLGYPILIASIILIAALSYFYSDVFFGFVFNSNINFKVSNLISLNWISFSGILILMLALFAYYLMIDIVVTLSTYVSVSIRNKLILFVFVFVSFCVYELIVNDYSVFFIFIFLLVLIVGKLIYSNNGKIAFTALLIISLLFATLVSIKLNRFENVKELEVRKRLLLKLQSADDPYSIISFIEIEKEIAEDVVLKKMLEPKYFNNKQLNSRINNIYLVGYLNKFDYHVYLFNDLDSLVSSEKGISLGNYRKQVELGSFKVSQYFYRLTNTFGSPNYFAIIPLNKNGIKLGTIVVELQSKDFERYGAFPHLLQNGKLDQKVDFVDYSYAFYRNNKLINQYGNFIYDLVNNDFKGRVKEFVMVKKDNYDHIIYQPSQNKVIIITHPSNTFWRELASLSFFFILFLLFSLIVVSYKWVWKVWSTYEFSIRNLKFKIFISNNKILYRTRIQVALVLAVVSSLLIIGIITFSYISIQYKEQQQDLIQNKIKVISEAFESSISNNSPDFQNSNLSFEEFSKMYNTDLNLFDQNGKLLFSTQNKIFAIGLIADRMNPIAYINLKMLQKSEFIQEENIDKLKFTSAYMPVKDLNKDVVAYLQLPYFSNQDDYNQKIGTFLNLLINIYVLVFVAIGFFAFIVANQITSPLSLIQESISKTMIGKKNKPIEWKRNDEIGSLIKEYNAMIETLEENANKLAQSEREIAWREMAKQVAHEIKNPLTPLKLGIQMLDRSWRDKDIHFDDKFLKFSKSFLEQIDSLSRIASEFSNFAKMPELKLENLNLLEVLNRATQVYSQMNHIQIITEDLALKDFIVIADKDQLLRAFNNLLKNAIEAITDGREGVINITGRTLDHSIEITINDNGKGIPEDLKERIFVPNFTTKSSGTGLGLASVKQAVENMGGNIYFTTEINVGTTFYIILPLVS